MKIKFGGVEGYFLKGLCIIIYMLTLYILISDFIFIVLGLFLFILIDLQKKCYIE